MIDRVLEAYDAFSRELHDTMARQRDDLEIALGERLPEITELVSESSRS